MDRTRPELAGDLGMVASTHWLASASGMAVLERGGNAFDAAATAGFVLQVVEPHLNGPGGEVPIILWSAADGEVSVVCGQGVAPRAATVAAFRDLGLDLVPGTGPLAATVPGAFGAWMLMLRRWGTLPLRDILEPAIGYARRGFPALPGLADTIAASARSFLEDWPPSAALWLRGGRPPEPGERLRNRHLASVYERILRQAERSSSSREGQLEAATTAWYRGFVAEAIDAFCAGDEWKDTSGRRHRGLLRADDMEAWHASVEQPATYDYAGCTVCKTGAWGQGPVFLQQLALLEGFDLAAMGLESADYVHTVLECAKLAFADREAWYGDGPALDAVVPALLDRAYNAARRRLVSDRASLELRPGTILGSRPLLHEVPAERAARRRRGVGTGEPSVPVDGPPDGDTCHVDVADRFGNMVSATPSGGWLQSSPAIPTLGFPLGTRAQMFWLDERLPGGLRPGARPRTTLSPGLALRGGEPWLAFGTPGGDQQDQWGLLFLLALVHGGADLQQAVDAPAFHSLHAPSSFFPRTSRPGVAAAESRLDAAVVGDLRRRGHVVDMVGPWSLGRLTAVARDRGFLRAAATARRGQAYACGR